MTDNSEHVVIDVTCHKYGNATALRDVYLGVRGGEFVTFLGPSGCGKTTLLRIVAGFLRPTEGRVLVDGRDITRLNPNRRPLNMVFQRPLMFPHLDVFENVAFGLRIDRIGKEEIRERVGDALDLVRLPGFERRRATELSGGQIQRVSLARALVNRPEVLLLDEPLSALDLKIRLEMEGELRRVHRETGATFLYVTHDQGEALSLSDRVVVFNEGHVEQVGTPTEIYDRPASEFAARFVGHANVIPVNVNAMNSGRASICIDGHEFSVAQTPDTLGPASLVVRAEEVVLLQAGEINGEAVMRGTISDLAFRGSAFAVKILIPELSAQPIKAEVPPERATGLSIGQEVRVTWNWDVARIIPREDESSPTEVEN